MKQNLFNYKRHGKVFSLLRRAQRTAAGEPSLSQEAEVDSHVESPKEASEVKPTKTDTVKKERVPSLSVGQLMIRWLTPTFRNIDWITSEQKTHYDYIICAVYEPYMALVILNPELTIPNKFLYCHNAERGEYIVDIRLQDMWQEQGFRWYKSIHILPIRN